MLRFCSALVLVLAAMPALAGFDGTVRVIDGDTLDVGGVRVRLHGIDAPEVGQSCRSNSGEAWDCGTWVSRELRSRYQGRTATCAPVERDQYGRVVAVCRVGGSDLGRDLVRDGLAVAFRKYSTAYVSDEMRARRAGEGLHAGRFQRPSDYRQARRGTAAKAKGACHLKGNISRTGERIYHVPGQKYYKKTRISASKGERWFCSEAEARAKGWRRARR